jgi:hypothetical protein
MRSTATILLLFLVLTAPAYSRSLKLPETVVDVSATPALCGKMTGPHYWTAFCQGWRAGQADLVLACPPGSAALMHGDGQGAACLPRRPGQDMGD